VKAVPRSLSAEQRRALRLLAESSAAGAGVPQDALVRVHHFTVPVLKSLAYRTARMKYLLQARLPATPPLKPNAQSDFQKKETTN
jgi:hypothetical protein